MGDKIIGIQAVTEVSMTRKAMNRHCTKLLLKSRDKGGVTTETQTEEESAMDAKIMKSFAGLQALTGAAGLSYVAGLEEDKIKSFFDQTSDEQVAAVKTWEEAEKAKSLEAEAVEKAKSAKDPTIVALETTVAELQKSLASLTGNTVESALVEKAKAFPNVPNALDILKSVAGLSAEAQAPTLAMLKSNNELNGLMTARTIVDPSTIEGTPANVLKSKVKAHAAAKGIDENAAMLEVTAMPENAELIQQVRDEEEGGRIAA